MGFRMMSLIVSWFLTYFYKSKTLSIKFSWPIKKALVQRLRACNDVFISFERNISSFSKKCENVKISVQTSDMYS